jgi:hypothetical protein
MSIGLATRGVLGSFVATTGSGTGAPYPLAIEDMEVFTFEIERPILEADLDDEPASPIDFDNVVDYFPTKHSTIETLPEHRTRTYPRPRNL